MIRPSWHDDLAHVLPQTLELRDGDWSASVRFEDEYFGTLEIYMNHVRVELDEERELAIQRILTEPLHAYASRHKLRGECTTTISDLWEGWHVILRRRGHVAPEWRGGFAAEIAGLTHGIAGYLEQNSTVSNLLVQRAHWAAEARQAAIKAKAILTARRRS